MLPLDEPLADKAFEADEGSETSDPGEAVLAADDTEAADAEALNAEVIGPAETEPALILRQPAQPRVSPAASESASAAAPNEPDPPKPDLSNPPAETARDERALAAAAKQKERLLREYFRSLLDQLIADYTSDTRGLEIREVAGGFRLATKPEYHDAVRGFVKTLKPPLKLSLQALETLAVVAYKQPVTAPEISEIRGVDSAGVLGSLMTRKLVTTAGRKQVIGRPILYKTTRDFLLRFGLKDISELPSIEEFEKMAGELNAAVQEEIPMEASTSITRENDSRPAASEEDAVGNGSSSSLDELNSAAEPTHMHHDTPEDLMSDRSSRPEGHNREHADPHQVEAQPQEDSGLRAEDNPAEGYGDVADEIDIDGRISGPPPDYTDDSPSAEDAREQQTEPSER